MPGGHANPLEWQRVGEHGGSARSGGRCDHSIQRGREYHQHVHGDLYGSGGGHHRAQQRRSGSAWPA